MRKDSVEQANKLFTRAKEQGKILDSSEAFKLYPVEAEAHKGKLEYWTKRGRTV